MNLTYLLKGLRNCIGSCSPFKRRRFQVEQKPKRWFLLWNPFFFFKCSVHSAYWLGFCFPQSERLKQVLDHLGTLKCLCSVLGMDFKQTVSEVHHSLEGAEVSVSVSNETIERLASAVHRLREMKLQRMQKVIGFLCMKQTQKLLSS